MVWLHGFLSVLTATGFPAPRPIPAFSGDSWVDRDGAFWELVSYLPGRAVGWRTHPTLGEVGQFMARFHDAVVSTPCPPQRAGVISLEDLPSREAPAQLRNCLDVLAADLAAIERGGAARHVVHGDFTAHNVVAVGSPAVPAGVIDFALAHVGVLWADIGFGLWRSGRPRQSAIKMDQSRVGRLVAGYASRRALPASATGAIATYTYARGLQQAVKGCDRGLPLNPMLLARVMWLIDNRSLVEETVANAIAAGWQ